MQFSFDLISDLHIETWPGFDWTSQATSPFCVVAGDIAKDRSLVVKTLKHLAECYRIVLYIDGNDEHKYFMNNLGQSYQDLDSELSDLDNIIYLQDNVVVIDGVAIIGTNGWWSFDLDPNIDPEQTQDWWLTQQPDGNVQTVEDLSRTDAAYMLRSIERLQTHQDVKKIVVVTHTVPRADLINHDLELINTYKFSCMGNNLMNLIPYQDTENKIHTWCFGHYHNPVDRIIDGIRYTNNCRGRGNTEYKNSVYFPKKIIID